MKKKKRNPNLKKKKPIIKKSQQGDKISNQNKISNEDKTSKEELDAKLAELSKQLSENLEKKLKLKLNESITGANGDGLSPKILEALVPAINMLDQINPGSKESLIDLIQRQLKAKK